MRDHDIAAMRPSKNIHRITLVRVSGEAFTYEQIAARTGLSRAMASQRVRRLRAKGLVTWEGLGVKAGNA